MASADYSRHFGRFVACPTYVAQDDEHEAAFWRLMRDDPRPRKLLLTSRGNSATNARRLAEEVGDWLMEEAHCARSAEQASMSTRIVPTRPLDQWPKLHRWLRHNASLPKPVQSCDLYPFITCGDAGTGVANLAIHKHSTTAIQLLRGEKNWAFRAPGDPDCQRRGSSCPFPFDLCAHIRQIGREMPCVQRAGETLIFPDGWFHGTCNSAEGQTLGWGGQGRRVRIDAVPCSHRGAEQWCEGHSHSHGFTRETLLRGHAAARLGALVAIGEVATPATFPQGAQLPMQLTPHAMATFHAAVSMLKSFVFKLLPRASQKLFQERCNTRADQTRCTDEVECVLGRLAHGTTMAIAEPEGWEWMNQPSYVYLWAQLPQHSANDAAPATAHIVSRPRRTPLAAQLTFRAGGNRSLPIGKAALWVGASLASLALPHRHIPAAETHEHRRAAVTPGGAIIAGLSCRAPLPANEEASWKWRRNRPSAGRDGPARSSHPG